MKKIDARGIREFMARHEVAYKELPYQNGKKLILDHCPFNAAHTGTEAAVLLYPDGGVGFKCQHDSCKGKKLPDFLKFYEPDFYRDSALEDFKSTEKPKDADPAAVLAALQNVEDVEEEEVEWLIPFFLPRGAITALGGDGGVGKTMTWCAIAAAISTGSECFLDLVAREADLIPAGRRQPGKVLFFSSEDSVSKVLRKRLKNMGADLSRIFFMEPSNEAFSSIKFDSQELRAIIEAERPDLVIFDPLQSFIPEKTDMSRRNAMRAAMNPLIGLAEENSCAILISMHSNKRMGGAAGRNRLSDSSDIWDICRSVWLLGKDRRAETPTFYLSHEKGNYGQCRLTALYNTEGGILNYLGTSERKDADFITANDRQHSIERSSVRAECKDVIRLLLEENGRMEIKELNDMLKSAHDFSNNAIKNAKADLKRAGEIRIESTGQGAKKKWYISPEDPFTF